MLTVRGGDPLPPLTVKVTVKYLVFFYAFPNHDDHHGWLTRRRQKFTWRMSPLGADIS